MIRLLAIALLASCAWAQAVRGVYTHEYTTTGTSQKITLQLAAGSARTARLIGITVYCATASTFTLERDGTAASGSVSTPAKLNSSSPTASVAVYNNSNVGSGTLIKTYNCAAGEEKAIDLTDKGLLAGENFTTIPALNGARFFAQWREF